MMIKLAVYGHYDSRGGTTAIPVAEFSDAARAAADRRYHEESWGDAEEFADYPAEDRPAAQDWLGWAELDIPDGAPTLGELDDDPDWWVIAEGHHNDDDDGPDFVRDWPKDRPLRLRLASQHEPMPEGWGHPRWDDDAYSFILYE